MLPPSNRPKCRNPHYARMATTLCCRTGNSCHCPPDDCFSGRSGVVRCVRSSQLIHFYRFGLVIKLVLDNAVRQHADSGRGRQDDLQPSLCCGKHCPQRCVPSSRAVRACPPCHMHASASLDSSHLLDLRAATRSSDVGHCSWYSQTQKLACSKSFAAKLGSRSKGEW